MTIRYEINPPKISDDGQDARNVLFERIETISSVCSGIHLTDSVLGIPRVSPFEIAKQIRESDKNIKLTCSLRVRDKNLNDIEKIVEQSVGIVDGILVLMGDKSDTVLNKDELVPSQVVKTLNDNGLGKKLELFLSIPNNPNFVKIQKKIDAKPAGFFTQVIHSKEQIEKISDRLKPNGFNINDKCGSTYPSKIQIAVKKYKAHVGISFDGDADRIIMCDENSKIIDGDQIIAMLARRWKSKKILKDGVIGTLMSNHGLNNFLRKEKIKFLKSKVGDRYVKEKMKKLNFNLGGEQSGHIILGKFATTGDGLMVLWRSFFH